MMRTLPGDQARGAQRLGQARWRLGRVLGAAIVFLAIVGGAVVPATTLGQVQIPVHIPINVCGNTVNSSLNPAFGNSCPSAVACATSRRHMRRDGSHGMHS